jgi:hypothetical protein
MPKGCQYLNLGPPCRPSCRYNGPESARQVACAKCNDTADVSHCPTSIRQRVDGKDKLPVSEQSSLRICHFSFWSKRLCQLCPVIAIPEARKSSMLRILELIESR